MQAHGQVRSAVAFFTPKGYRQFEKLVAAHQHRVYGYACYLLGEGQDAEEVTQDALLRLWDHLSTVDPERVLGWLLRVTRNLCFDRLRKRRSETSRVVVADETVEAAGCYDPTPDADLEAADFQTSLRRALDRLAEPYRSIVVLREVQDLTYDSIAEALDLPLNTVKVYLHRGRRMLRESLMQVEYEPVE